MFSLLQLKHSVPAEIAAGPRGCFAGGTSSRSLPEELGPSQFGEDVLQRSSWVSPFLLIPRPELPESGLEQVNPAGKPTIGLVQHQRPSLARRGMAPSWLKAGSLWASSSPPQKPLGNEIRGTSRPWGSCSQEGLWRKGHLRSSLPTAGH